MTLVQVTAAAHVTEAQAHLIEQFKGKANFLAMIQALVTQIGDLEAAAFEVLNETTLAASVGVQLDGIGSIVGEDRLGRSDADYRQAISGRILINLSSGTAEDLAAIFNTLEPTSTFAVDDFPPASFLATLSNAVVGDSSFLGRVLTTSRPAGVDAFLIFSLTNNPFLFAPDTTPLFDATNSFGLINKVVNGDFDTNKWTADDPDGWVTTETGFTGEVTERGFTQGNGGAGTGSCNLFSGAGDAAKIAQTFAVEVGRRYAMIFTVGFAGSGDMLIADTGAGAHFSVPILAITTGIQAVAVFDATAASITLEISITNAAGNDVTIDKVFLFDIDHASLTKNIEFDRWTGDDPDDWVIQETPASSEVSQVGSGESAGGVGFGAANMFSAGGAGGTFEASITQAGLVAVVGREYELRLRISKVTSGTAYYGVGGLASRDLVDEAVTEGGVFLHRFIANDVLIDVDVTGTAQGAGSTVAHDFTIDWLELVDLEADTVGLLASAIQ